MVLDTESIGKARVVGSPSITRLPVTGSILL